MSGSGQEALSVVWEWLGDPSECPGVVDWPSHMSRSGREVLPNVRERFGGCADIRGNQGALPDVREWLEDPPGCSGVVRRPSLLAGSGW